jgi:tRNA 2-thiouridine synthesizing protein E
MTMPTTTIEGFHVDVDDEGFLADPAQWNEDLADALAAQIGIALTDRHRRILDALRSDFQARGETATLRRAAMVTGVPVKELFVLFPKKPAKKMAYVAGLPKPTGCL